MQIIINILTTFSIYLLVANSFALIYYPTKYFHIAHAAIITLGAYSVYFFYNLMSIPMFLAIPLGVIAAAAAGILCELVVYRKMRHKNVLLLAYLVASIGVYVILQNCISLCFGDDTKIMSAGEVKVGNLIFGAYITNIQLITVAISILLFLAVNLYLRYTISGKSIRAVAGNPELCGNYGISSDRIILIAFGIGSALAAIAGMLWSMDTNMTPTFGFNILLSGIVAMIIGGVGSTGGMVWGSLLVASAQHITAYCINTSWMDAVTYVILILFLIWKPLGFSGKKLRKVEV